LAYEIMSIVVFPSGAATAIEKALACFRLFRAAPSPPRSWSYNA